VGFDGAGLFSWLSENLRATSRADISRYVANYIQGKPHVGLAIMSEDAATKTGIKPEELIGNDK
jgi:hypothetical protein